jgi:hypothetical protein
VCACLAVSWAAASSAFAAAGSSGFGYRGWGARGGGTFDPDQIHAGVHVDMGNLATRLRFQPNVEVGFGDDVTAVAVNFEALYFFSENWDGFSPYTGAGLGVNYFSFDVPDAAKEAVEAVGGEIDDSETDAGITVIGGVEKGFATGRFLTELKLGLIDAPDFKVTVGWTFGGR